MNAHSPITDETRLNMTSKGQVLMPKAIRDKVGLVPGRPVRVGINDRGEAVVLPEDPESAEERKARYQAAIESVRGIIKSDLTTDEMMKELRGDEPFI